MPNADTTLIDRAEETGVSLATYTETRGRLSRGVRPWPFWSTALRIPGDTTTPPVRGVGWIGIGDT